MHLGLFESPYTQMLVTDVLGQESSICLQIHVARGEFEGSHLGVIWECTFPRSETGYFCSWVCNRVLKPVLFLILAVGVFGKPSVCMTPTGSKSPERYSTTYTN